MLEFLLSEFLECVFVVSFLYLLYKNLRIIVIGDRKLLNSFENFWVREWLDYVYILGWLI